MSKTTFKTAQEYLAYRRMSISKKDGEYRVNFLKDGTEDSAYYTNDIEDAMGSGDAMASARMMREEENWPTWPRLALKKKDGTLGCLILGGNVKGAYSVYVTNIYRDIDDSTPVEHYATEHLVVAAGWRVD